MEATSFGLMAFISDAIDTMHRLHLLRLETMRIAIAKTNNALNYCIVHLRDAVLLWQ